MDGDPPKDIDNMNEFETSGSNHIAMRERNERLVLTILRRLGALPKAEIARKTGLSAQTVSVIMRALERDGLLEKGDKLRGKVGQPSVPMRLAPSGAFFLGLKVGRRSAELVLVNFVGEELAHVSKAYAYPTPEMTMAFVRSAVEQIFNTLSQDQLSRIAGLGIASPFFLWEWASMIGVAEDKMAAWRDFDLKDEISKLFDFPVFLGNDATSACGAELTFGTASTPPDFLYVYIGYFVGGGVVLNGTLYPGKSGNAGAIGPFPVITRDGTPSQLVDKASMIGLERLLMAKRSATAAMDFSESWVSEEPEIVNDWLDAAVPSLAQLIGGACSIIDFQSVLIDGNMPPWLRSRIVSRLSGALDTLPLSGLIRPEIVEGTLGARARPLGAASLPLSSRFMLEA